MGVFHLGKMTLSSMFKKPETLLYPLENKEPPQGLKGSIAIDPSTCILCGMCSRNCPCGAIAVDKAARTWSINHFQCIQPLFLNSGFTMKLSGNSLKADIII